MAQDQNDTKQSSCSTCASTSCKAKTASPGENPQDFEKRQALYRRMCGIRHKILVMSGKGGVGKSRPLLIVAG